MANIQTNATLDLVDGCVDDEHIFCPQRTGLGLIGNDSGGKNSCASRSQSDAFSSACVNRSQKLHDHAAAGNQSQRTTGPEAVFGYNRQYINDVPATRPHGSDSNALRELLESYGFDRRTWHSNAKPRENALS